MSALRTRHDLCPGVFRPWPAQDGALVRVRLVGGRLSTSSLAALSRVARRYGDGDLQLTARANLQLRGLRTAGDALEPGVVRAIERTGLLPSRSHELVRNIMVSPLTGVSGGRADLRPVARRLDELLCADPDLADLPGRFLFVLDDGRGDLTGRPNDLGLVALDRKLAQLCLGSSRWGPVVTLDEAATTLTGLCRAFLEHRGAGSSAAWHLDEIGAFGPTEPPDPRTDVRADPPPYEVTEAYEHVRVPDGVLSPKRVDHLLGTTSADELVVTPWHGVVIPR